MIISNTYFVHVRSQVEFVDWLKENYIPKALESGILSGPRLIRVLGRLENDQVSYLLQFNVAGAGALREWHNGFGKALDAEIHRIFEEKVLINPVLMEELDCF